MSREKKLYSISLALIGIALLLIFFSSAASAATEQSASSAGTYAYITNADSNTVSVIDTVTNNVTANVSVGNDPYGVAVNPSGTKVYVTNAHDNTVSVIDTATNTVTNTVNVGKTPLGVAVSPDGTKVYVTNANSDTVSVIDTTTNTVTANVNVGFWPHEVAFTPDGTKAYVVGSTGIRVIDTATNKYISWIDTDSYVVAVSPDGTKLYASGLHIVNVIDTATYTITNSVYVGYNTMGIAVNQAGTKVYVTNANSDTVSVIDTTINEVTATVTVEKNPLGVAVNSAGTKVYVANSGSNTVSVIDTATNNVIATVPVGNRPVRVAVGHVGPSPEGTNLYLSNYAPEGKSRGPMTYTLYYGNFGNASANNVILENKLPSNVEFESASDGGVYDSSTKTVRWNIGSVHSAGHGYRTLNVIIPNDIPIGTVIVNDANISTSDHEVQYDDNEAQAKTTVTGLILPLNVGVEPNNGGTGIPSVIMGKQITFSYHNTGLPVTGVNITIHFDDGLPDITGTMINVSNSTSDWTYTTTLNRHGKATVTYTKQFDPEPYKPSYDIRGDYGDFITADDIYNYIKDNYPQSPMLSEPDIGSRFINAANTYGIDPAFLVALAETDSQFGTVGWAAEHPEAHNAFGYGVVSDNNTTQFYSASSWGDIVDQVAWSIAKGPNFFSRGCYTVEDIIRVIYTDHSAQYSNQVYSEANPNQVHLATIPIAPIAYVVLGFLLNHYADKFYDDVCEWVKYHMNDVNTYAITQQALNGLLPPLFLPISFDIYVDPAGYIYDVDTGKRISGASVWLQRPDGNGGWQNISTGENPPVAQPDTNPLISDKDGMYQWDTLPGSYRVHVEAQGYESADSIIVSVPPPVFDLHVGLHHVYDPNILPILPVANFSNDISLGYAPLNVQFTDLSENATGISWDFGDETSSTDRYPIHTYSVAGNYTVTLTASNGNGVNSKTGTIDVQAVPIYPLANFVCNTTEGYAPLSVQFKDLSENVNGIKWEFGDGTNSTDKSPVHTYFVTGNYIATLTVSNDNGTSSSFAMINVSEHHATPPQSISNLQSSAGSTWINWTWINPTDPDFDHTEIYLNDTFQINTSAEYFNATGLQPETSYTLSTRTVDNSGNVNQTWVNSTATTDKEVSMLPVANFSSNVSEGYAPLSVQFTDLSENVTEWNWDFDDGDTSTDPSPMHTYYTAGNYTVNLTVSNMYGTDSKLATITVSDKPVSALPVANFSAKPTSGKAPLKVTFTDTSTGFPTSWKWDFGDGSKSYLQNPTHKYSKAGIYTVSLTVKNAAGRNTVTKTEYIKVIIKPVANFTSSVTSGKAPLKVTFTDTSTGSPTSWFWNFGDGSKSFHQNPTHKYSKAGIYTVSLTVKNAKGRNTVTKTEYIKVITKPVADFTSSATSGKAPLKVKFTDTSKGTPAAWKWDFGDGSKSFHQNPTHKYSKAGVYTVSLKVKNAAGSNTVTKTEYIIVITKPVANFTSNVTSGKAPLTVAFTDTSTGIPAKWKWSFGDGATSTEQNPEHQYLQRGGYKVTLTVSNAAGGNTITKTNYIKVTTNTRPGIYSENK